MFLGEKGRKSSRFSIDNLTSHPLQGLSSILGLIGQENPSLTDKHYELKIFSIPASLYFYCKIEVRKMQRRG